MDFIRFIFTFDPFSISFPRTYQTKLRFFKWLRHSIKNLRLFLNLRPSGEGLSYKDWGVKSSSRQCRLAYGTNNIVQVAFVRWRGDSKIVEANAEHDFRLKRLIGMLRTTKCAQIFCTICQAALPGRPFDTPIL